MITLKCSNKYCEREYTLNEKSENIRKYCTDKCRNIAKKKFRAGKDKVRWIAHKEIYEIICENCKIIFQSPCVRTFCSKKCQERFDYKKLYIKKPTIEQKCGNQKCNIIIKTKGNLKTSKKFCSKKCASLGQYYREKDKPERHFRRDIRNKSLKISEIFIKSKSSKCELCGSKEGLHIHHKKYTIDFNDWQLLCKKCHLIIHPHTYPQKEKKAK
jgi:hypothetical protein